MGYLDTMYAIVKKCKLMARAALEEGEREREREKERERERERKGSVGGGIGGRTVTGPKGDGGAALAAMWKERGSRMTLIIASQFIEMKVRVLLSLPLMLLTVILPVIAIIRSSRPQRASSPHSALHPHPNSVQQSGGYSSKPDSSTRP